MQDDSQELRRRLEDDIEGVLSAISPGWVKRGSTAYLTAKGPKELGSFTVSLGGNNRMPRGCFYRFSQSIGGGSIELVAYTLYGRKDAYKEAFDWARNYFGIERSGESAEQVAARKARQDKEAAEREERRKRDAADKLKTDIRRMLNAKEVWDQTVPLAGTHGEAYLVARGIPPIAEWPWDPGDTLRFHPTLDFEPDRDAGQYPAIVCKVVDVFDGFLAVWQIFLDRDRPVKADLMPSPKIGRGPASGGAVRIGGDAEWIDVCEGVETALGAWFLGSHRRPCWSLLSTSGMKNFEPPLNVKRINLWPDGDKAVLHRQTGQVLVPPGRGAAEALVARLKPAGIKIAVNDACRDGDALDMYLAMQKLDGRAA